MERWDARLYAYVYAYRRVDEYTCTYRPTPIHRHAHTRTHSHKRTQQLPQFAGKGGRNLIERCSSARSWHGNPERYSLTRQWTTCVDLDKCDGQITRVGQNLKALQTARLERFRIRFPSCHFQANAGLATASEALVVLSARARRRTSHRMRRQHQQPLCSRIDEYSRNAVGAFSRDSFLARRTTLQDKHDPKNRHHDNERDANEACETAGNDGRSPTSRPTAEVSVTPPVRSCMRGDVLWPCVHEPPSQIVNVTILVRKNAFDRHVRRINNQQIASDWIPAYGHVTAMEPSAAAAAAEASAQSVDVTRCNGKGTDTAAERPDERHAADCAAFTEEHAATHRRNGTTDVNGYHVTGFHSFYQSIL